MDAEQFKSIVDKLDKVTRLMAIQTVKGLEKEQEKIELLDSIGFRPSEIDKLLNKTPGYASAALANIKKKQSKASQPQTSQPRAPPPARQTVGGQTTQ